MNKKENLEKKEKKKLAQSITKLTELMKQLRSERYLQMVDNPRKFLFYNFIAGAARGIGWALGTTIILGLIVWILSQLIDTPLIGDWIGNIVDYIQNNKQ